MKLLTRRSVVVIAAAAAAVGWACEMPERAAAPHANSSSRPVALASARRAPSAHVRRVADVHNRALMRFFGNIDSYIGKRGKRTQATRCAGLRRLTREVLTEAAHTAGLQRVPSLDQALVDAAVSKARTGCGEHRQASLFVPRRLSGGDDIITPSVLPHLEALLTAYESMSDPFASTVATANDGVLGGMAEEPQHNYDIVYMTTQFAMDDAALWVSFGEALGDDTFCEPELNSEECLDPPDEMTLFAPKTPVWVLRALYGTVVDLAACITSEIIDAHAGNVSEREMYLRCVGYGAAASAAAGMKLLDKSIEDAIKRAITWEM